MNPNTVNKIMAGLFFLNITFQCVAALSDYQHLFAAAGYFCALLMCGVIEEKDKVIVMHQAFADDIIQQIRAL